MTNEARQAVARSRDPHGPRLASGIFLGVEAAVWVIGNVFALSHGPEGVVAGLMIILLVVLTLWAIDQLSRAPRRGVWLGLALQGLLLVHGLAVTFFAWSLFGIVEVALGIVTAICLAKAMPSGGRE